MRTDYEAYEGKVERIMERINHTIGLEQETKDIILTALSKQISKKLIRLNDGAVVRYQCPTCRHVYWMKSMLSCEHCGQMLVYRNEGETE